MPDLPYECVIRTKNTELCNINFDPLIEKIGDPLGSVTSFPNDPGLLQLDINLVFLKNKKIEHL